MSNEASASTATEKSELELALEKCPQSESFKTLHAKFMKDMSSIKNIVSHTATKMVTDKMRKEKKIKAADISNAKYDPF